MKKEINLVAKRALELIKEKSNNSEEYKDNLVDFINLLNDELKKEIKETNKKVLNEEINKYVEEKNGEAIYNIIKAGAKGYDMDMLIDAVIQIGDADAILSSVVIWKNKNIKRVHFLKCAKALVELKAVEEIVHFINYCGGDRSTYNSYNIMDELVKFVAEDDDLRTDVIKYIVEMKRRQGRTPSCYMSYGTAVTTEISRFAAKLGSYKRIEKIED